MSDGLNEKLQTILKDSLGLDERFFATGDQQLLNSVPQLDSASVLHILVSIEESFDLMIADDAVGAEDFFSFETLLNFVRKQIDASSTP